MLWCRAWCSIVAAVAAALVARLTVAELVVAIISAEVPFAIAPLAAGEPASIIGIAVIVPVPALAATQKVAASVASFIAL